MSRKGYSMAASVRNHGVQMSDPEARRARAWEMLKEWTPRVTVVATLIKEFGVSQRQAYDDVADLYAEMARHRGDHKKAEVEAMIVQLEQAIEELRGADEPSTFKAKALVALQDQKAKLMGAYPSTGQMLVLKNEMKVLTGFTDDQIDALIAGEEKRLLSAPVLDARSMERADSIQPPSRSAAAPVPPRSRRRGRGSGPPDE